MGAEGFPGTIRDAKALMVGGGGRWQEDIREENLLQMVLWKMVHFALFLVKFSINFSPSYSTVFFHHSVHLYFTKISKLYYKNFKIFVQCFNK
jgi:hypothetical protein